MILRLPPSKTDYIFRQGCDVTIAANYDQLLCPVKALLRHWELAPLKDGYAPLFQHGDGTPVTYEQLQPVIDACCRASGMNAESFKPHSFRIGAATTAALLGIPAHAIKVLGRWRSVAYQIYTKVTPERFSSFSRSLLAIPEFCGLASEYGPASLRQASFVKLENLEVVFAKRNASTDLSNVWQDI